MTAINSVAEDQGRFVQAFRENVLQVIGSYEASEKETEILKQIEACQKKLMELMETGMKNGQEDFEQEYEKIMRKMKELQKARAQTAKENRLAESCQQRTADLEQYMGKTVWLQREFDEELVRRLIRVIKVVNENKLEMQFHAGIVMVQRMDFESRNDVAEDEYIEMIRLKTAVLLAASLKIGAILAGASAVDAENLYNFGMQIGVAFQLQDDLLDVYGDPEVFGKKIGGDILCNKKTYMLIKALERANGEQLEELNRWLNADNCQPAEKIAAVTEIYNQLTIRSVCENKMREYYTLAMESLEAVAVAEEKKKELKNLVKLLMYREM